MSDNNDDNENQNEDQAQVSKLPKPSNIDNYFMKIQSNPKPWQIQAKVKPNPYDKNARITFKTHQNKFIGWDWKNNAKVKFQAKDGKTKVSINLKMLENGGYENNYRKYKNQGNKQPSHQQKQKRQKQQKQKPIFLKKQSIQSQNNKDNKKQGKQNNNNSGDLDFNLSTSYDNSKFNLRLKDNGQVNIKFNQSADVITNTLKAQFQYLYEYKNKADIHKYMFQLLYTTGVRRWVYGDVPNQMKTQPVNITIKEQQNKSKVNLREIYKLLKFNEHIFHKNQTKIRGKIGSHCDVQIKLNSVNHFGNVKQVNQVSPAQVSGEKKQIKIVQQPKSETQGVVVIIEKPLNTESSSSEQQPTIPLSSSQSPSSQSPSSTPLSQNQPPLIKLQLQNKLTLKFQHDYNFKTTLCCESLPIKQNLRFETIINRTGLHNIQSKYLCKYWAMYAFGAMLGINWNQHAGVWNRKWEFIVQRQNIKKIGNMLLSVSDKCAGFRIVKKLGKIYKIQLMASRRWNAKQGDWPNFGVKLNANW